MPKISEMSAPALPITGLELIPGLQGGDNAGVPLLALGGLPTGNVVALRRPFVADLSATADADPGAGKLRWDNAAPASAATLYVNNTDSAAGDVSTALAALTVGGFVYVQGSADGPHRGNWQKWQVAAITTATGYTKLGVSLQASAGSFAAADVIELTLQQPTPAPGVDRNLANAIPITSGVAAVDCALGDYFTLAPTAAVTGWTLANVPPACSLIIRITQDATTRAVAWPASFRWAGGTAGAVSTGAGAVDLLAITTVNGGATWLATLAKGFV